MIRHLKALLTVAAKKDVRYYLNGVHVVYVDGQTIKLEASDGHIALRLTLNGTHGIAPDTDVILCGVKLRNVLKMFSDRDDVTLSVDSEGVAKLGGFEIGTIDGRYPDLSRVIDRAFTGGRDDVIGLNFTLLETLCKACKTVMKSEKFPVGKFQFRSASDQMIITSQFTGGELKAAIMPVRL